MPSEQFMRLKVDRRNVIIKALTRQFATREYDEITVKELSDEADISRGSFYIYFADKEDAFMVAVENYVERLEHDLLNIYEHGHDIPEVAMQVFDYLTHLSTFERDFFQKINNNLSLGIPDIITETFERFGSKIDGFLLSHLLPNQMEEPTSYVLEQFEIRKELLYSVMISSLVSLGLNKLSLNEARERLKKKVDLILSIPLE